jgi:predicted HicB family RNase H-like nuclease
MSMLPEYKGYLASVEYSDENEVFHGRLEFIRDLVTFEGEDARALKAAFHEAVDDYLALCAEQGRRAEVPLKGSFNVRPGRDLHRRAMLFARRKGLNLNAVVTTALTAYLDRQEDRGGDMGGHKGD